MPWWHYTWQRWGIGVSTVPVGSGIREVLGRRDFTGLLDGGNGEGANDAGLGDGIAGGDSSTVGLLDGGNGEGANDAGLGDGIAGGDSSTVGLGDGMTTGDASGGLGNGCCGDSPGGLL